MTRMKRWLPVLLITALSACSGGQHPAHIGLTDRQLAPCPASPNCVSSQAGAENQRVEALRYNNNYSNAITQEQAQARLLSVLKGMERVTVIRAEATYVHAEFRSAFFGFVDDVEFHFDPPGVIQLRSASRVGHSDFGVNRARVAAIRERFSAPAGAPL